MTDQADPFTGPAYPDQYRARAFVEWSDQWQNLSGMYIAAC